MSSSHGAAAVGTDPELAALISRCAPTVAASTMAAIVSTESRGHQFAIADAGPLYLPWAQRKKLVRSYYLGSVDAATALAEKLIANGHTVSLGLSQVNDRNLAGMNLTVRQMFDPCANLGAGGKIMTDFYKRASRKFGPGTRALNAALSAYNSGDWVRGERDGYVDLIYRQQGRPLALSTAASGPSVPALVSSSSQHTAHRFAAATVTTSPARSFALSANNFVIEN
jgi:type IV secretion system protein VirB1